MGGTTQQQTHMMLLSQNCRSLWPKALFSFLYSCQACGTMGCGSIHSPIVTQKNCACSGPRMKTYAESSRNPHERNREKQCFAYIPKRPAIPPPSWTVRVHFNKISENRSEHFVAIILQFCAQKKSKSKPDIITIMTHWRCFGACTQHTGMTA